MKRMPKGRDKDPVKTHDFERERLFNLIESKIRRRDRESAAIFAEELFRTEVEFAIFRKTKELKSYTTLLLKIILLMIAVILAAAIFMAMNINPSFNLVVQTVAVVLIISFVALDTVLVKRFERALDSMMEAYETRKQSFIKCVTDSAEDQRMPDIARQLECLTPPK